MPATKFCSSCGAKIKKEAELCVNCGVMQLTPGKEDKVHISCAVVAAIVGTVLWVVILFLAEVVSTVN